MKKTIAIAFIMFLFVSFPMIVNAGPKELNDTQMTDASVETPVAGYDKNSKNKTDLDKKSVPKKTHLGVEVIKNPVDNPDEINKSGLIRLDNQAADQKVNDQIRDNAQGIIKH